MTGPWKDGFYISAATTGLLHATIYALDSTTKGFHNIPDVGDLSQLVLQLVRRCHHRAGTGHLRVNIMDGFQCAAATALNGICNLLRELYDGLEKEIDKERNKFGLNVSPRLTKLT